MACSSRWSSRLSHRAEVDPAQEAGCASLTDARRREGKGAKPYRFPCLSKGREGHGREQYELALVSVFHGISSIEKTPPNFHIPRIDGSADIPVPLPYVRVRGLRYG